MASPRPNTPDPVAVATTVTWRGLPVAPGQAMDAISAGVHAAQRVSSSGRRRLMRTRRRQRRPTPGADPVAHLRTMLAHYIVRHDAGFLFPMGDGIALAMGDPCVYCNGISATLDHLVAAFHGGGNRRNLAWSCMACNRAKDTASLLQYLVERAHRRAARAAAGTLVPGQVVR